MRSLVFVPLVVMPLAAAGWVVCRAVGLSVDVREILIAGGICLLAGEMAVVPIWLARGASQAAVAQAGLVSTLLYLFVAVALSAAVFLKFPQGMSFTYWLLGLYLGVLMVLVSVLVRTVKSASPAESRGS